jgi:UDP:flavonoid glycosyltransferase YjiC (YdhE family)
MPLIADQPNNAARIVARGAGLLLQPDAAAVEIRAALARLLAEPSFRDAARKLGEPMVGDKAEQRAADELEAIAHTPSHTTTSGVRS